MQVRSFAQAQSPIFPTPIHAVLCIDFSAAAAHGTNLATLLTMTAMVPIISLIWYGAVGI